MRRIHRIRQCGYITRNTCKARIHNPAQTPSTWPIVTGLQHRKVHPPEVCYILFILFTFIFGWEHTPPDKVKEAHRRVMVANHPDAGGSHYLASKINEAKDVMLGKTKGSGSAF
ncbi:hypothetical protein L1049_011859 [Liquidambar formosana]|uniref:Mitochondrial import inner membrane translocase subunit TIM14 n=1 Tax=Liquidambar formosana TaxID=63359 RepID=A0AAP0RXY8_LIQFO